MGVSGVVPNYYYFSKHHTQCNGKRIINITKLKQLTH